ncbi:MAG: phosphatidylglycerophosphatase A [Betaproteobacteria bacterium]
MHSSFSLIRTKSRSHHGKVVRPGLRFLLGHVSHFFALGFGSGLAPFAPGTFGTLVAFPLFSLLNRRFEATAQLVVLAVMYLAGIWFCERTGRDLGVEDHGSMVWDEIVAFMIVLFFTPRALAWQVAAFLLFRFFDAAKPGPIRYIESRFRGGFGVMIDDLAAAFCTLLCLTLYTLLAKHFGG